MRVYLASPLGFSPENVAYRERVKAKLRSQGHEVVDPWDTDWSYLFKEASSIKGHERRLEFNRWMAYVIGNANAWQMGTCEAIFGILDGAEPDSGTVGEVCFGAGASRVAYGLRTDFRDSGDMPGVPINLQVLYFIESSGGKLFRSVDEISIPLKLTRLS